MASKILPRYLLLASTIAIVVIGVMLSMFYGQYRWLASSIVETAVRQHDEILADGFLQRSRDVMHRVGDSIVTNRLHRDAGELERRLRSTLRGRDALMGIAFISDDHVSVVVGEVPTDEATASVIWSDESLALHNPVGIGDMVLGRLAAAFSVREIAIASEAFRQRLLEQENEQRRNSYLWIGAVTLITLTFCGLAIWLIAKTQTIRIRELKGEAEKLSEADFGAPIPVLHGDELGELAEVFNRMREQLRNTTISRDYLDSVLASMNEAIIVTSADGKIGRAHV